MRVSEKPRGCTAVQEPVPESRLEREEQINKPSYLIKLGPMLEAVRFRRVVYTGVCRYACKNSRLDMQTNLCNSLNERSTGRTCA